MTDIVEYRWSPSPRLYRITRLLLAPLITRYFRTEWSGHEHVPADGAVVLASNHLSNLDPVLLAAACPRPINFLAKAELFHVPVLGSLVRRYGAIPLRRSAADPEAIRLAELVLQQQQLLALFPEGTRSRTGKLKPFRFGAARLALKYDAPLVPVAITGSHRAMPAGAKLPQRAIIRVAFGPAIATTPFRYHDSGSIPQPAALEAVTNLLYAAVQRLQQERELHN